MDIGVLEYRPVATVSMAAWAEAIPHICGVKAIPTSLILISLPRIKIVNQIKSTIKRFTHFIHDSSISPDPHFTHVLKSVSSWGVQSMASSRAKPKQEKKSKKSDP